MARGWQPRKGDVSPRKEYVPEADASNLRNTMKTYEVTIYATVEADSLQEAEMLYSEGDYSIDYHEISDYDETDAADLDDYLHDVGVEKELEKRDGLA